MFSLKRARGRKEPKGTTTRRVHAVFVVVMTLDQLESFLNFLLIFHFLKKFNCFPSPHRKHVILATAPLAPIFNVEMLKNTGNACCGGVRGDSDCSNIEYGGEGGDFDVLYAAPPGGKGDGPNEIRCWLARAGSSVDSKG